MDEARKYIELFKNVELKKPVSQFRIKHKKDSNNLMDCLIKVSITCLAKMNKSSPEEDAINCLVVGTEQKIIYIIDSEAFTILATVKF